jgi:hypothetical protein
MPSMSSGIELPASLAAADVSTPFDSEPANAPKTHLGGIRR